MGRRVGVEEAEYSKPVIDRDHQHVPVTGQHPAIVEVTRTPAVRLPVYKQHHRQLGPIWKDKSDTVTGWTSFKNYAFCVEVSRTMRSVDVKVEAIL